MSIFRNLANAFVPVRERREITGSLSALNAELVLPLNGDQYALVTVQSTSLIGTLEFTGAADTAGTLYLPIMAYPVSVMCAGGTIPLAGQPVLVDALVAAMTARVYAVPVGQLKAIRVRASAYTSGASAVTITSDVNGSLLALATGATTPSTLYVTATGAASAAVTATLPAVPGLRHYIDEVSVLRSATAALVAAASPVVVTTTNLPGSPALTFGSDAGGVGIDIERRLPVGLGIAGTALGTATTIVAPVWTGVIWRINAAYHLGP